MADAINDENEQPGVALYSHTFEIVVGDFKGQQTTPYDGIPIKSSNLNEFSGELWRQVYPKIIWKDPLRLSDLTAKWLGDHSQHEASGKLNEKKVRVFVQKYSNSLANRNLFVAAEKALLKHTTADRAGAATNSTQRDTVTQLKDTLLAGPRHEFEQRMTMAPPPSIISHFRSIPTAVEEHQRILQQSNAVAIQRNGAQLSDLRKLLETEKATQQCAEVTIQHAEATKRRAEETLASCRVQITRLERMIDIAEAMAPVLDGFSVASRPTPTVNSQQYINQVTNHADECHSYVLND
ncbi:hypothetical protein BDR26DRAFT_906962 [Obelidium mucronatum]|nr:hypothetical protein BDR26DRAFT_906962 [Obelidium mucronatum]